MENSVYMIIRSCDSGGFYVEFNFPGNNIFANLPKHFFDGIYDVYVGKEFILTLYKNETGKLIHTLTEYHNDNPPEYIRKLRNNIHELLKIEDEEANNKSSLKWTDDVLEEYLKSDEIKERRKKIKESSEKLSKSMKDSLSVSNELLKSKINI